MEKKEFRWYFLWFIGAGMWTVTFLMNLLYGGMPDWNIVLQFLNIIVCLAAGIVNRDRYRKRNEK